MYKNFILVCTTILLVGCASSHVYKEVMKDEPAYNLREFLVSKEDLYKAVVKTIMSKNFMIEKEEIGDFLLAKRSFQKGKRTIVLLLQAKLTSDGENKSSVYLSAIETKETSYVADRTRFFLWIVPLPGGGGKEVTRGKEGEEVITDEKFYQNLFSVIERSISVAKDEKNSGIAL